MQFLNACLLKKSIQLKSSKKKFIKIENIVEDKMFGLKSPYQTFMVLYGPVPAFKDHKIVIV